MKKSTAAAIIFLAVVIAGAVSAQEAEGIKFQGLDPSQLALLAKQGSMLVIKYDKKGKLREVVAASLVNAPAEKVWAVLTDFDSYPKFIPQTTGMRVVKQISPTEVQTEQTVKVEIWVLKVMIAYQHLQKLDPNKSIKFNYVSGDLPGTFGRYDLVELPNKTQTLLFYTLYSNLTALPWPVGPIMKSQPDFMTSVNVSTTSMVVKAIKEEVEQRASGK
jgi:ribosome-associated toxin RatA of RatAB toxin-antitoxin module